MTINVLGAQYRITVKGYAEDPAFDREGIAGYCAVHQKEIVLCDMATFKGWEHETAEDIDAEQRRLLRHEIVHAFLTESGLSSNSHEATAWARNEEMVDWFALQGPKIYAAWAAAGALPGKE